MSIMPVDTKSMAYRLQTVWMQRCLGDPCLFHATLYAGSAHLDASRGDRDNPITLFHHTEVMRHVRDRLADSEHKMLDEAIGAVIPLAFFSVASLLRISHYTNGNNGGYSMFTAIFSLRRIISKAYREWSQRKAVWTS